MKNPDPDLHGLEKPIDSKLMEQPPPGPSPSMPIQVAPLSWPLRFFRVILWFLPCGFVAVSAWVTGTIGRAGYNDLSFWLWVLLNLVFILTAAWSHVVWSTSVRLAILERQRRERIVQIVIYFSAQVVFMAVLIPLIVISVLSAVCGEFFEVMRGPRSYWK